MRVILASASPRRQALLRKLIAEFSVCPSDADETLPQGISAERAVALLAQRKAEAVAQENPGCCVIGADTVVELDSRILGKPEDRAQAIEMLESFSGRTQAVYTGMAVVAPGSEPLVSVTRTEVDFYSLSRTEIEQYVDTGEPYDKAGGYGVQEDGGCRLVKAVRGDPYNVVGLPVAVLYRQLRSLGVM